MQLLEAIRVRTTFPCHRPKTQRAIDCQVLKVAVQTAVRLHWWIASCHQAHLASVRLMSPFAKPPNGMFAASASNRQVPTSATTLDGSVRYFCICSSSSLLTDIRYRLHPEATSKTTSTPFSTASSTSNNRLDLRHGIRNLSNSHPANNEAP